VGAALGGVRIRLGRLQGRVVGLVGGTGRAEVINTQWLSEQLPPAWGASAQRMKSTVVG